MPATSDDLEIFVFPAANSKAQENLLKSIENPIQPESTVFDGFEKMSEDLRKELNRIKNTPGGFYAWGAEPRGNADSTWGKMARGDYVLAYYSKGYQIPLGLGPRRKLPCLQRIALLSVRIPACQ